MKPNLSYWIVITGKTHERDSSFRKFGSEVDDNNWRQVDQGKLL